jgi:uncharacterized repeat protein (TIGR02543 family)
LPTITRTGYTFGGWFTTAAFTAGTEATTIPTSSTGNKVFYAKWTAIAYDIVYNENGGTTQTDASYTIESATITLPTITKTGYTFGGWFTTEAFTAGTDATTIPTSSTGDKAFYAKWTAIAYDIVYNKNGGDSIPDASYTIDSADITLPTITRTGYTFGGWYTTEAFTTGTEATTIPTSSTGDKEFWAKWTPVTYTIVYNENNGRAITDGSYTIETEVVLPRTLRSGYTFGGWFTTEDLTGSAVSSIVAGSTGNKEFWVKWNANSYTITFNERGGDSIPDTTYTVESEIELPSILRDGYSFGGWYLDAEYRDEASTTVIPVGTSGNLVLYAKWNEPSPVLNTPSFARSGPYAIFNLNGKPVRKGFGEANLSGLSKGVYILRTGSSSRTIVVP